MSLRHYNYKTLPLLETKLYKSRVYTSLVLLLFSGQFYLGNEHRGIIWQALHILAFGTHVYCPDFPSRLMPQILKLYRNSLWNARLLMHKSQPKSHCLILNTIRPSSILFGNAIMHTVLSTWSPPPPLVPHSSVLPKAYHPLVLFFSLRSCLLVPKHHCHVGPSQISSSNIPRKWQRHESWKIGLGNCKSLACQILSLKPSFIMFSGVTIASGYGMAVECPLVNNRAVCLDTSLQGNIYFSIVSPNFFHNPFAHPLLLL